MPMWFFKTKKKGRSTQNPKSMVRKQIIIGILLTCAIGLLLTGVYHGSRIPSMQITKVTVIGGQTIPHARIEKQAKEVFAGSYFKLVPKSFRWTFSESAIESRLAQNDRVKNVQVAITDSDAVTIVYDEYIPVALWCEESKESTCLFLDQTGYAFAPSPVLDGGAFVRFIAAKTTPQKSTQAFSSDFISENTDFVELLQDELDLYVTEIKVLEDYDIEYTVSGGGVIKVSQSIDLEKSFKNLRTILQSDDFSHLTPGSFQYIDLRFGDKIFVNEEIESAQTATTTEEVGTERAD